MPASALLQVPEGDDDRYRQAMAASALGIGIAAMDGRWIELNPAIARMFGYAPGEMLDRPLADFVHAEDAGLLQGALHEALFVDAATPGIGLRGVRRNGQLLWLQAEVAAVRDAAGRTRYLVVQLRDIGAQRESERALHERNLTLERRIELRTAALEAANRQLDRFALGVSHDLLAPLHAIDSSAGRLQNRNGLDADDHAQLQQIRLAVGRMAWLIDGLLAWSRASQAELQRMPVDFSLLADWVGAELQEADPDRPARIEVQPNLRLTGDERQLKVLLGQLMHNAWKFSGDRGQVRIEVGGERDPNGLRLWVRDYGSGFDMRRAGHLFEPFQRLHGPEHDGGSGLGLAIARRIVERHGGRIWAESTPGVGSTFRFTLPDAID